MDEDGSSSKSGSTATFDVPAREKAVFVGEAAAGDTWRFAARGEWVDGWLRCGPDGYTSFLFHVLDAWPRLWTAPYFALVGMIEGRPETLFHIGRACTHTFRTGGRVVVFANDVTWAYWNNSGQVELHIDRRPRPERRNPPLVEHGPVKPAWVRWREVMDRLQGVPFILTLILGVSLALALLPQGRDLLRAVAEDRFGLRQGFFAAGLVFLALQGWFWPRVIVTYNFGRDRRRWPWMRGLIWGPRLIGLIPFPFVLYVIATNPGQGRTMTLATAAAAALFVGFVVSRLDLAKRFGRPRPDHAPPSHPGRIWVLGGFVAAAAAFVAFSAWPVGPARVLGPPAMVFMGVGLFIPPFAILIQSGAKRRIPVIPLTLGAALLFGLYVDNHRVGRRALTADAPPSARPITRTNLDDAYRAWRAQNPGDNPVMVLVAAEGGASRAGYWTGEVLSQLHIRTDGALARHLFAISSVSGGSVGAVGYVAALEDPMPRVDDVAGRVRGVTGPDALSPDLGGLLFTDLAQRFLPFEAGFLPDRAEGLERSWEDAWRDGCAGRGCKPSRFSDAFLDLWPDNAQGWTPLVIINGTSEELGAQILTSKLRLRPDQVQAYDFYDTTGRNVRTSTAIHNGARFPYVSPAGTLVDRDGAAHGHIIDGGYFDGAGTEVVRELAHAIKAGPGKNDHLTLVFVYIGYRDPTKDPKPCPPNGTASAVTAPCNVDRLGNEVLAPPLGLLSARDGHAAHLARNLKADVDPGPEESNPYAYAPGLRADAALYGRYVPILLCPDPGRRPGKARFEMPMDWALSEFAKAKIRQGVFACGRNADMMQIVADAVMGPSAGAATPAQARAFVEALYAAYAHTPGPDFLGRQAGDVFSPRLLALLRADAARTPAGEVGTLDGDPICNCQDYRISEVSVTARMTGAQTAQAVARFRNLGRPEQVTFDLSAASGAWRVDDLHETGTPSLAGLLAQAERPSLRKGPTAAPR